MNDGVFIAKDSRWRVAAAVFLCLLCVSFGAILTGLVGPAQSVKRQIFGWIFLAFFVPVSIGLLPRLFDKKTRVKISSEGVYSRSWSGDTIPWREIARISTWDNQGKSEFILLHLIRPDRFPPTRLAGYLSKANSWIGVRADLWISFVMTDRHIDDALAAIDRFQNSSKPTDHRVSMRSGFGGRRF